MRRTILLAAVLPALVALLALLLLWAFVIGPFLGFQSSSANAEMTLVAVSLLVVLLILAVPLYVFVYKPLAKRKSLK